MLKNSATRYLSVFLISFLLIPVLSGCDSKEKEIVISNDIREDIKVEEKEIETLKYKAQRYLEEENFQEAKNLYDKVILMDKGNKELYLEIKDEYIKKNRFDDAYEIIKVAIDNKVDVEDMQQIAEDIKNNFEVVEYDYIVKQGEECSIPTEGTINVRGEDINVPIHWSNQQVDTSSKGAFEYEGVNEQYGRSFKLKVEVVYKPLTELEVRDITAKAKNVLTNIINCLNFDDSTMISEDGRSFAISNIYKSREDVYNALYDYYTDEAIYSFLDNYTLEKDCTFYIIYGQGGVGLSVLDDNLYIEQTETTLRAIYTKTISDNWTVTQQYDFIKYDNCWIRADITLYP